MLVVSTLTVTVLATSKSHMEPPLMKSSRVVGSAVISRCPEPEAL